MTTTSNIITIHFLLSTPSSDNNWACYCSDGCMEGVCRDLGTLMGKVEPPVGCGGAAQVVEVVVVWWADVGDLGRYKGEASKWLGVGNGVSLVFIWYCLILAKKSLLFFLSFFLSFYFPFLPLRYVTLSLNHWLNYHLSFYGSHSLSLCLWLFFSLSLTPALFSATTYGLVCIPSIYRHSIGTLYVHTILLHITHTDIHI